MWIKKDSSDSVSYNLNGKVISRIFVRENCGSHDETTKEYFGWVSDKNKKHYFISDKDFHVAKLKAICKLKELGWKINNCEVRSETITGDCEGDMEKY